MPTTLITVNFFKQIVAIPVHHAWFKFRIEFGCAFLGDEKDYNHFVRVKALKMNTLFIPHVTPGTPPNQASMFSMLMAAARAKSVANICFINDNNNELEMDDGDDVDDHDDDDDFMVLGDWFGLQPPPAAALITNINHVAPAVPRFTRSKFPCMKQYESTWWTRYLAPEVRTDLIDHPNGRHHGKFRVLFHVSFSVFLEWLDILKRRWYPNWRESMELALLENLCRTLSLGCWAPSSTSQLMHLTTPPAPLQTSVKRCIAFFMK